MGGYRRGCDCGKVCYGKKRREADHSDDTLVKDNTVAESGQINDSGGGDGIGFWYSDFGHILNNQVNTSHRNGIQVMYSDRVLIEGNTVSETVGRPKDPNMTNPNSGFGIILYYVNNTDISKNSVSGSRRHGIPVYYSNDILIAMNTVSNSGLGLDPGFSDGIKVENSNTCRFFENQVSDSNGNGIGAYLSIDVVIENNLVSDSGMGNYGFMGNGIRN